MASSPHLSGTGFITACAIAFVSVSNTITAGATATIRFIGDFVTVGYAYVMAKVDSLLAHVARVFRQPFLQVPDVNLTKARAFDARVIKRDRPWVTASWRMCPSI